MASRFLAVLPLLGSFVVVACSSSSAPAAPAAGGCGPYRGDYEILFGGPPDGGAATCGAPDKTTVGIVITIGDDDSGSRTLVTSVAGLPGYTLSVDTSTCSASWGATELPAADAGVACPASVPEVRVAFHPDGFAGEVQFTGCNADGSPCSTVETITGVRQ